MSQSAAIQATDYNKTAYLYRVCIPYPCGEVYEGFSQYIEIQQLAIFTVEKKDIH